MSRTSGVAIEIQAALHQTGIDFMGALLAAGLELPALESLSEEELVAELGLIIFPQTDGRETRMRIEPSDRCLERIAEMCIAYRDHRRALGHGGAGLPLGHVVLPPEDGGG